MRSSLSKTALVALAATLTLGLSACGSNDTEDGAAGVSKDPVATIPALSGESTAVTLDPGFLEGLTSLKLTPATIGGAKLDGAVISFPITGGNVTYFDPKSGVNPYVQGIINHEGSGLQLTGGGKVVKLENFVVDPAKSVLTGKVTVDGAVAFPSAPLFFLDGTTLKPLATEGEDKAVLEGTTVSLTKEAAGALNMVFGTDALAEFFKVGVAKITVNTK